MIYILIISTLLALSPTGIFADTIYTYTGDTFRTVSGVYTLSDSIRGSFVLSDSFVVTPRTNYTDISGGVIAWNFTDGHQTLTQDNSTLVTVQVTRTSTGGLIDPAVLGVGFLWIMDFKSTTGEISSWHTGDRQDTATFGTSIGFNCSSLSFARQCQTGDGSHRGTWTVSTLLRVSIDIKPGSFPNSINRESEGNVPVALLSSATFDATTADRGTVMFTGASPLDVGQTLQDVNGDGLLDVVFHFATQSLTLPDGTGEACLTGSTTGGTLFIGCDSVRLVK